MKGKGKEKKLGDRRDFWNTNYHPITGFYVSPSYYVYVSGQSKVNDHKAEYHLNN